MPKVGSFSFATPNLGDDMQVLAASVFLPFVDRLVDRDKLSKAALTEPHLVIMNSWFQLADRVLKFGWRKKRYRPSDSITPLFYGFCVGRDRLLNDSWTPYLAEHQPIGSRDRVSVEKLAARSIAAHWTGCITAFFGRHYVPVPATERSGIVIVDVPRAAEDEFVPRELRERAKRLTNAAPAAMLKDPLLRMHQMALTCDVLRRAELVITSRLHIALPCVGFGTPVVVVVKESASSLRRFSGFDEFLPIIFFGGRRSGARIDWASRMPAVVPQEIDQRHAQFISDLQARLGEGAHEVAPGVATKSRIVVADHDFGGSRGELLIDLGSVSVTRPVSTWTKSMIAAEINGFSTLRRFNAPLCVRPAGKDEWIELGPLSAYIE